VDIDQTILIYKYTPVIQADSLSAQPQPRRGELYHGEKIGGELVLARGDAAEVLQLGQELLDQIALAVEPLAEQAEDMTTPETFAKPQDTLDKGRRPDITVHLTR
jgi:hypothetical protein